MNLIFRVELADESIIIFQHISFVGSVELKEKFVFRNKKETIFGSAAPMVAPEIQSYNVNIGFTNFEKDKKAWFFRKFSDSKTKLSAYVWIFKFDQLKDINPKKTNEMQSVPVPLRKDFIINLGECDLKIKDVE